MNALLTPVPEVPWALDANGERIASGTASPGLEQALAAGVLIANGYLRRHSDLIAVIVEQLDSGAIRLDARVHARVLDRARQEFRHTAETGCGLLHFAACDTASLRSDRRTPPPDPAMLAVPLRSLFEVCDRERPGGGVHGAALVSGSGLRFATVDVGRHAAVQKTVGAAFLEQAALTGAGLILTARISGLIALIAARAGLAWVASRSIPTTLAVALANAAGLPLLARVGSRTATVLRPDDGEETA